MIDYERVREILLKAITKAMNEIEESIGLSSLPYHGTATEHLMTDAAMIILKALDDTEEHLRSTGVLSDE